MKSALKKIAYSGKRGLNMVVIISVIVLLSAGCSSFKNQEGERKIVPEQLIWQHPDSALLILNSYNVENLDVYQLQTYRLDKIKASLRMGVSVLPDSINPLFRYFQAKKNYQQSGEAAYSLFIAYNEQQQYDSAMYMLKETETYLPFMDSIYSGMVYYHEGVLAEREQLFHIASERYQKALPFIRQSNDSLRIACCLRDAARMQVSDTALRASLFGEALRIAKSINHPILYDDILVQQSIHCLPMDSDVVFEVAKTICDSFGIPRYTNLICAIAMERGDLKTAEDYFSLLENDTIHYDISRYTYYLLRSKILQARGEQQEAYSSLEKAYLRVLADDQQNEAARTYAISRHYDVEKEQKHNLELKLKQQQFWLTTGMILTGLLLACLCVFLIYLYERNKRISKEKESALQQLTIREKEQEIAEKNLQQLQMATELQKAQAELEDKRNTLRQFLKHRVALIRQIHQSLLGSKLKSESVKKVLDELSLQHPPTWQKFEEEFNAAYGDILKTIRVRYPSLNEYDIRYIALSILEITPAEMACVFQMASQSVWNRRDRLKKHLGNPNLDFEEWIQSLREKKPITESKQLF